MSIIGKTTGKHAKNPAGGKLSVAVTAVIVGFAALLLTANLWAAIFIGGGAAAAAHFIDVKRAKAKELAPEALVETVE